VTEPLPVPLAPEVTAIHDTSLAAVHEHALLVVTLVDPVPAEALTLTSSGEIEYEQTRAACVTVNVSPAIVRVPDRDEPMFGRTAYATLPSPVPDPPDAMVIHDALLAAVHVHALVVDTFTLPVPPSTGNLALFGEIE
jgi:hypothetical protein